MQLANGQKNVGKENFGTADYNVTIFTGACIICSSYYYTNFDPQKVIIVMMRHSIDTIVPMYVMTSTPVVSGPGPVSFGLTSCNKNNHIKELFHKILSI